MTWCFGALIAALAATLPLPMRDTLRYFMWGFQQHFRSFLQSETGTLLDKIGLPVKPRALLVGFAASEEATWPLCVEPEYRFFQAEHFDGTVERARELYESHPNRQMMHSDPRMHDLYHRSLHDRCRADAIVEALQRHTPESVTYFVGHSAPVGNYEVHPVLGIPADALAATPQLTTVERDRFTIIRSLVHGCIETALRLATKALYQPDAGESFYVLGITSDELAQRAAADLVTSSVRLTGSIYGNGLYSALAAVSTTRYEGDAGFGSIIATRDGDADVAVDLRLRRAVPISETRTLRKLLEISDRDKLGLLTDGNKIFGLGHVRDGYDAAEERIFEFHVVGEGQWLMRHAGVALLQVEFGQPHLPKARIDKARFTDTVSRVFADGSADGERLWGLALAAADQAHGTMLVISQAAAEEAARLSAQATLIEPAHLSPELLRQATSIDGAVLFSPDGTCHALGVILDGTASAEGDRARGARYNSALRYLSSARPPTMTVLVSEDGMINVLPWLQPRIARATVERALETYDRLTTDEEVDGEMRADALKRLEQLRFYLTAEQCARINELESAYQQRQLELGGIMVTGSQFKPDPSMNESYFLD
jgi:hypothetical protein